jgi:hypothetical protein
MYRVASSGTASSIISSLQSRSPIIEFIIQSPGAICKQFDRQQANYFRLDPPSPPCPGIPKLGPLVQGGLSVSPTGLSRVIYSTGGRVGNGGGGAFGSIGIEGARAGIVRA